MGVSSDISGLFKLFGGHPEHYQELAQAPENHAARMDKAELAPSPIAVPDAAEPVTVERGEVAQVPAADAVPVGFGTSLQSLLAKLAQERAPQDEAPVMAPAADARVRPQL